MRAASPVATAERPISQTGTFVVIEFHGRRCSSSFYSILIYVSVSSIIFCLANLFVYFPYVSTYSKHKYLIIFTAQNMYYEKL